MSLMASLVFGIGVASESFVSSPPWLSAVSVKAAPFGEVDIGNFTL